MASLPDHIFAPPLRMWLPTLVLGKRAAVWGPSVPRAPRKIRTLLESWPLLEAGERADTLVVFSELADPRVPAIVQMFGEASVTAARILELAVPVRRGVRAALTPWRTREIAARAAADRFAQWTTVGMRAAEQWVSADPVDVVVTHGRWSPLA